MVIISTTSMKLTIGILVSPCRLSICPSVDNIMSALYLPQYYPDPFHIHTSYQPTADGVSDANLFFTFQNLNFCQIFLLHDFVHYVLASCGCQVICQKWMVQLTWDKKIYMN